MLKNQDLTFTVKELDDAVMVVLAAIAEKGRKDVRMALVEGVISADTCARVRHELLKDKVSDDEAKEEEEKEEEEGEQ